MPAESSNPYRPPRAEVDDFRSLDAEPGSKPQQVFIAVVLLWVTLLVQVAMIERGRNWARFTYLVLYLLGLPFFLMSLRSAGWQTPSYLGSQLVQAALQTCALVFLFLGPSREWFRGQQAA